MAAPSLPHRGAVSCRLTPGPVRTRIRAQRGKPTTGRGPREMAMTDIEQRLARLESTVRRLADIEDIRALRLRYHECVNRDRAAEIPDLFTDDAELDFGYLGRTRGRPKITKFFAALPVLP